MELVQLRYLLLVFYAFTMTAHAAVLHVPADYRGIQVAIDAAAPGDLVLVMPGTYKENLDFLGKPITVQSRGGPESTGAGWAAWSSSTRANHRTRSSSDSPSPTA